LVVSNEKTPRVDFFGARYSKCADESRKAQLARIEAMTPLERMAMALALGRRRRALLGKDASPKR
jgi:hypothetical protein